MPTAIWRLCLRSVSANCDLELAVEVGWPTVMLLRRRGAGGEEQAEEEKSSDKLSQHLSTLTWQVGSQPFCAQPCATVDLS